MGRPRYREWQGKHNALYEWDQQGAQISAFVDKGVRQGQYIQLEQHEGQVWAKNYQTNTRNHT